MSRIFLVLMVSLAAVPAFAQDAPAAAAGSPLMSALPLAVIFFIFFFLVIRPQMKQGKLRQAMIDNLQRGDVVVTGGGALGKITRIVDDVAHVEIAQGMEVKMLKSTIVGLYTKPDTSKVAAAAEKKNPAVKNDNVVPSKNKVANDN